MNKQTAQLLEQHFDIAFAAPEGIARLRELILTLAMQGMLVEQDPNDPPASELLKEIEAEKQRLVKAGKIKKPKPLPTIKPEEVPYELPQGWEWVRLPECYFGIGNKSNQIQTKDYRESGQFPVVDQGKNFVTGYYDDESKLLYIDRPVIVFGDHTKNIKFVDFDFIIGADGVKVLCPFTGVSTKFLYRLIQSFDLTDRGYARHFKVLNEKLAPLPPLPEQQRIVARIDQLMARCDALEKLCKQREEKRLAVHAAAIEQLLDAPDGTTWDFIQQHFDELYTVKENVAELRKAILQLAVMGHLVPQNPNDPPVSELLKEIEAEKQRLLKTGKIKKPKPLPPIKPEEVPYQLPQGWKWVYLQDVFGIVTDGDHQAPPKSDYGIPFLVIGNLNSGKVDFDGCRYVPQDYYEALDWGRKPARNDILYTVTGSYGIPVQVEGKEQFCVQRHVAILKSLKNTPVQYIRYLLRSTYALNYATAIATGIAQKTVPLMGLRSMLIALPPATEQHRIVACIDKLMALYDTLEQQIDATTGKKTELLKAIMAQV